MKPKKDVGFQTALHGIGSKMGKFGIYFYYTFLRKVYCKINISYFVEKYDDVSQNIKIYHLLAELRAHFYFPCVIRRVDKALEECVSAGWDFQTWHINCIT